LENGNGLTRRAAGQHLQRPALSVRQNARAPGAAVAGELCVFPARPELLRKASASLGMLSASLKHIVAGAGS